MNVKRLISQLSDLKNRDQAARELIRLNAEAVIPLIESLQTADQSLLPLYGQILARIPSASPALAKALATAHPLIRQRVVDIFALTKNRAAVPSLIDALRGEYYTVRVKAATALGVIGDTSALPSLLASLKDSETEVRVAAVAAVGGFRDPKTFDALSNLLLDDPILEVRQATARALGETRHPDAVYYLMQALRDSFWWYEREQSAGDLLTAIEKMGAPAVDSLVDALNDREGTVRKFAATILGNIRDKRALEPLGMAVYDLHIDVSLAAALALAQFGEDSLNILAEALSHPETGIREHVIRALGKIQSVRVAPLLLEKLHDPERIIQKQTIISLSQLRDPRADSALMEIANNRNDREFSALAKKLLEEKGR